MNDRRRPGDTLRIGTIPAAGSVQPRAEILEFWRILARAAARREVERTGACGIAADRQGSPSSLTVAAE